MDVKKSLFDNLQAFFGFDNFKGDQESEHQIYGKNYLDVLRRKYKINRNNIILK